MSGLKESLQKCWDVYFDKVHTLRSSAVTEDERSKKEVELWDETWECLAAVCEKQGKVLH